MTITIEPTFFFVFVVATMSLLLGALVGGHRVYNSLQPILEDFVELSQKQMDVIEVLRTNFNNNNKII